MKEREPRLAAAAAWLAAELARLRESQRARLSLGAALLAALTVILPPLVVVGPWLADTSTYGFHDWDVQTSHRYLVRLSIRDYGEFPGWNPYACGGFPAWGYVESGTIVVSPFLPLYLFGDLRHALRVEVLGMALFGAWGTYLAAGRLSRSRGARAVAVAVFAVNGRWALQAASGHTWHLAYALLPWSFWAFERARAEGGKLRDVVLLGACFAMLVYAGGIYPLPHTVLMLGLYAAGCSVAFRTLRPALVLAIGGLVGVGLAAPKLLPLLSTFERAPRLIESTESFSLGALWTALVSRQQAFYDRPADVTPYGWHEWGIYVGVLGAALLVLGALLSQGKREAVLKLVGVVFVVLGLGAFHERAPWTLLHEHAPVFRSQHVPSRFLYPATFVLGLTAASWLGGLVQKLERRHPAADVALGALALALALDIASVAQKPMRDAMWMVVPDTIPKGRPFRFEKRAPFHYVRRDWAGPQYLAMLGNTGVIDCYGAPPFEDKGALSHRDRRYRGEAFVDPRGEAVVTAWSPNGATIDVTSAPADAWLVYNMNYDPGWRAAVEAAGGRADAEVRSRQARVAVRLPQGASRVVLSYTPPGLHAGLAMLGATVLVLAAAARLTRSFPR